MLSSSIRKIKSDIDAAHVEEQQAERAGDLSKVAEISYGKIVSLQKELEEQNRKLAEIQEKNQMLKEEVSAEDIAEVVAKWTGIPVDKLLEGEREKLVQAEQQLARRVIGQKEAIERRGQCRTPCPGRPAGS